MYDVFIGVAAVADYRPKKCEDKKIKKSAANLELKLVKTPDIISEVAKLSSKPFTVGFAAETDAVVENGREKLRKKNLDLLFANNAIETFNNDYINVTAIDREAEKQIGPATKLLVARQIIELISANIRKRKRTNDE